MAHSHGRMTSTEFLGSSEFNNGEFELIGGLPARVPDATVRHEQIVTNVLRTLSARLGHDTCKGCSPGLLVPINDEEVFQPSATIDVRSRLGDVRAFLEVHSGKGGERLAGYMSIGVPHILFVSQARMQAVSHVRVQSNLYVSILVKRSEDVIELDRLGVTIPLAEIYRDVDLGDQ